MNMGCFLVAVLWLATLAPIKAAVPLTTSFQGRVTVNGANFTGTGRFKFVLVARPAGTSLWSNDGTSVNGSEPAAAVSLEVAGGLFSVRLGDTSLAHMQPLTARMFQENADVALRIWFDDGVHGSVQLPDEARLASVPYALAADLAPGSITSALLAPSTITPDRLASVNAPTPGRVLTYDGASFNWSDPALAGSLWSANPPHVYYSGGNVGVGTSSPATALEASGMVRAARVGVPGQYLQLEGGDPSSIRLTAQSAAQAEKSLIIRNLSGEATPGANNSIQFAVGTPEAPSTKLTITKDGGVLVHPTGGGTIQLGTPAFERGMTILAGNRADIRFDGSALKLVAGPGAAIPSADHGIAIDTSGHVAVGRDLRYGGALNKLEVADNFQATIRAGDLRLGHPSRRGEPGRALVDFGTGLHLNFEGDWPATVIGGDTTVIQGDASVRTLTIRGGADLAEPFPMAGTIAKGAVVVIDEHHPGRLKLSTLPYDTRVAGIVSGANGINPGIALHQEGTLDEGQHVALSGRVYALGDATSNPIRPGDLLTTSETPGHAMRVMDPAKAPGAVLGKAMSALESGRGLVLVLVSLQ